MGNRRYATEVSEIQDFLENALPQSSSNVYTYLPNSDSFAQRNTPSGKVLFRYFPGTEEDPRARSDIHVGEESQASDERSWDASNNQIDSSSPMELDPTPTPDESSPMDIDMPPEPAVPTADFNAPVGPGKVKRAIV